MSVERTSVIRWTSQLTVEMKMRRTIVMGVVLLCVLLTTLSSGCVENEDREPQHTITLVYYNHNPYDIQMACGLFDEDSEEIVREKRIVNPYDNVVIFIDIPREYNDRTLSFTIVDEDYNEDRQVFVANKDYEWEFHAR